MSLKLENLNLELGLLRVLGKGSKERIVPIGDYALNFLKTYLESIRPKFLSAKSKDFVFLNRRGAPLTRQRFWQIIKEYAKKGGHQAQQLMAKENQVYRQDYCGCMFALMQQREYQQRLSDELISPIGRQILPESIEYRLQLYKNRTSKSEIIKQRFLNFRLLNAKVVSQNKTIKSYFSESILFKTSSVTKKALISGFKS